MKFSIKLSTLILTIITERENGILLYISVMKRRVWILGDCGINEIIEQKVWDEIVSELTRGIRNDKRCEAICEAVKKTGKILEVHLPIREDDTNGLYNIIIRCCYSPPFSSRISRHQETAAMAWGKPMVEMSKSKVWYISSFAAPAFIALFVWE